jgi:hypothetical protein
LSRHRANPCTSRPDRRFMERSTASLQELEPQGCRRFGRDPHAEDRQPLAAKGPWLCRPPPLAPLGRNDCGPCRLAGMVGRIGQPTPSRSRALSRRSTGSGAREPGPIDALAVQARPSLRPIARPDYPHASAR